MGKFLANFTSCSSRIYRRILEIQTSHFRVILGLALFLLIPFQSENTDKKIKTRYVADDAIRFVDRFYL